MAMYQLHIYLTVNAPSTLNAAGTRNYGVISILGVGITSLWRTPGNRHGPRRPRKGKSCIFVPMLCVYMYYVQSYMLAMAKSATSVPKALSEPARRIFGIKNVSVHYGFTGSEMA